jgi:O-acetyl-ADP-ribose deacetylase (regulator of RNase III)
VRVRSNNHQPGKVYPIDSPESIRMVVENCLQMVDKVERDKDIFPEGTEPEPEARKPIQSIVFPTFGTGHGGLSMEFVLPAMIRAFYEFPGAHRKIARRLSLKRIYVCIHAQDHVDYAKAQMDQICDEWSKAEDK